MIVEKLGPGDGCYAAHLTPQGKIVAHMHVFADDDTMWMELERSSIPRLLGAFDRLVIMEDVVISQVSDRCVLTLIGPAGRAVIEEILGATIGLDVYGQHLTIGPYRIARLDLGYDVWLPRARVSAFGERLERAGASAIDRGTWNVLRTEAGIPIYGVDIDEATTMPELGERGIDYAKGCYVGQEVVSKIKYIGHVNRRFVGLRFFGADLPEHGSVVQADGREVGYATTAVYSPGFETGIGLGFVHRGAYEPGTEVSVRAAGGPLRAVVTGLPFEGASGL